MRVSADGGRFQCGDADGQAGLVERNDPDWQLALRIRESLQIFVCVASAAGTVPLGPFSLELLRKEGAEFRPLS
jgi:hypothetical protein